MRFHIVTIFPNMFESYFAESIISRAISDKLISIDTYALRDFTVDKHRRVDGRPYGGGPGMVMWADPILRCVEKIQKKISRRKSANILIVLFNPGGTMFTNKIAKNIVQGRTLYTDIIFICGRYEGIDARVKKILKAYPAKSSGKAGINKKSQVVEWSIGEYVLTGGELAAMVCMDVISRQVKGVLHDENSLEETRMASHEMYARPEVYEYNKKKYRVPKVLLSGNHKLIDEYRMNKENKIGKISN
jgi:tRNA (guanine37-N1)-methyltransferase